MITTKHEETLSDLHESKNQKIAGQIKQMQSLELELVNSASSYQIGSVACLTPLRISFPCGCEIIGLRLQRRAAALAASVIDRQQIGDGELSLAS